MIETISLIVFGAALVVIVLLLLIASYTRAILVQLRKRNSVTDFQSEDRTHRVRTPVKVTQMSDAEIAKALELKEKMVKDCLWPEVKGVGRAL